MDAISFGPSPQAFPLAETPFVSEDGETMSLDKLVTVEPAFAHKMTRGERSELQVEARQLIQSKYDAGVPFFSKDVFRDAAEQLDRCLDASNPEQYVTLTALDGTLVRFLIEVGREDDSYWAGYKTIRTKPRLAYRTLHYLTSPTDDWFFMPDRAYLAIDIVQATEIRDARTNEVVGPWPIADYNTVWEDFKDARQYWEESTQFVRLRSILASTGILPSINKVVAFACGTITHLQGLAHERSLSQHVLLLAVRDIIEGGRKGEGTVKCFVQDPVYVSVDKQVLGDAGITVLDDPRAWLEVDEGTVVISIAPDIPVADVIADIARPAMMIMTNLWNSENLSPRGREMLDKEYVEMDFAEHECFEHTVIYVRKGSLAHKSAKSGLPLSPWWLAR